jgi:hypothetical protein
MPLRECVTAPPKIPAATGTGLIEAPSTRYPQAGKLGGTPRNPQADSVFQAGFHVKPTAAVENRCG